MSFLDKINANSAATAAAPAKKVNPLLKKKMGAPKEAEAKEEAPKKKVLPLKKKAVPAQEEETKQEAVAEETAAAPAKEKKTPAKREKAPEKKEESKEEVKEEAKKEKPKKEEVPEKDSKEKAEAKEEEKKEAYEKAETKKKPTSSSKSSNKKKTTAAKQGDTEDEIPTDIPTTTVSFNEAVVSITSPFVDEEWNEFKQEVQEELSAIQITDDMNTGTLKIVISELSILREKIWFSYQESKNLYEHLSSKDPEGLIERVKRINLGKGNNDMERKKAGIMACMKYSTEAGDINLFEVLDETRMRYNFLKSVIDSIKYKTDVLITMNGALKLEKDHTMRGE
ncbi:hypothetical protein P8918_12730 [Bacillus spizizenii]|nr:hypothetical protein [Bacillus spizizenii]MCY8890434.1 hypothetical protein [Bacillus spizizenii]MEC0841889.1 hypothetical protein [Bacillus spizizenii]